MKTAAGALAAVTTAVLLSTLGAAGTVIGAAIGSVVVTVGSEVYAQGLHRSRHTVRRAQETGLRRTVVVQEPRERNLRIGALPWRRISMGAAATFVVVVLAVTAFEAVAGRSVSSYTGGSDVAPPRTRPSAGSAATRSRTAGAGPLTRRPATSSPRAGVAFRDPVRPAHPGPEALDRDTHADADRDPDSQRLADAAPDRGSGPEPDQHAVSARARLEEERRRTNERLDRLGRDHAGFVAASLNSNADDEHDPEGATIAYERSQVETLARRLRQHLVEIEAAVARLDAGSYGVCERCNRPIPLDRLDARPTAAPRRLRSRGWARPRHLSSGGTPMSTLRPYAALATSLVAAAGAVAPGHAGRHAGAGAPADQPYSITDPVEPAKAYDIVWVHAALGCDRQHPGRRS